MTFSFSLSLALAVVTYSPVVDLAAASHPRAPAVASTLIHDGVKAVHCRPQELRREPQGRPQATKGEGEARPIQEAGGALVELRESRTEVRGRRGRAVAGRAEGGVDEILAGFGGAGQGEGSGPRWRLWSRRMKGNFGRDIVDAGDIKEQEQQTKRNVKGGEGDPEPAEASSSSVNVSSL